MAPGRPGTPNVMKADYQESQTVWKARQEREDIISSEGRAARHQTIVESMAISNHASCSECHRVGSTPVRCKTCRTRLCTACDKVVHYRHVTHQRECEQDGRIHKMLPTDFLTSYSILETISRFSSISCMLH